MVELLGGVIAGAFVGAFGCFAFLYRKKRYLLWAKSEAHQLLRNAREEIDKERKESLYELKNELGKRRSELDLEIKKTKIELQQLQAKFQKKQDTLDQREITLDELRKELQLKDRDLAKRLDILNNDEVKIKKLYEEFVSKLERISNMKQDEARRVLHSRRL